LKKVLILGATGMLGSACLKVFELESDLELVGTARKSNEGLIEFDADKDNICDLLYRIRPNWIINCIGLIKHLINENDVDSIEAALRINSIFPKDLTECALQLNANVIQIATDCVYSSNFGPYDEASTHDAVDVYGRSKSLGEVNSENLMILRCSVIGREINSHVEFMDWILCQPNNAKLNGFSNHLWNGLTTLHFAKICLGIISTDTFKSGIHHVLPSDSLNKCEMMDIVCKSFGREDIKIKEVLAGTAIDRRLSTKFPDVNRDLWLNAGYNRPLSIEEMITEYSNWVRTEKNV
jgi:dTDP-4-dehydrorhamnose reductase